MSSLTNTAIPAQDTITDLALYRRLVDSLTDVKYTGSGVGLERRRRGATRASDEMVLTIDGEALVAYRAVAAQAAEEANQIRFRCRPCCAGRGYVDYARGGKRWTLCHVHGADPRPAGPG